MKKDSNKISTSDGGMSAEAELLQVSSSPHMKARASTRSIMIDVIIALLPAYIWGICVFGNRALLIGAVSVISCAAFEGITQFILRHPVTISDFSACVTGLLLAMNLPVTVPLWIPVVGAFFAIVVVKQLFGGIGKNIVNPALAARVFLFSWASDMTGFVKAGDRVNSLAVNSGADVTASATPLASLNSGALPSETISDMFVGNISGSIGEVSAILLLAGGIYLLFRKTITWHIPVSFIGTVAVITYFFPKAGDSFDFMLYEILAGGLMLGAIFMATDYATSPLTSAGRVIYGVGCGVITVSIRYFGGYAEGVSFAVLIMNLLTWYLDNLGMPKRFGETVKKKKES